MGLSETEHGGRRALILRCTYQLAASACSTETLLAFEVQQLGFQFGFAEGPFVGRDAVAGVRSSPVVRALTISLWNIQHSMSLALLAGGPETWPDNGGWSAKGHRHLAAARSVRGRARAGRIDHGNPVWPSRRAAAVRGFSGAISLAGLGDLASVAGSRHQQVSPGWGCAVALTAVSGAPPFNGRDETLSNCAIVC